MTDIRTLFRLDALASGALGVLLLTLAGPVAGPLGIPPTLSAVVGAGLVAWAAFVAWASTTTSAGARVAVVVGNVAYVAISVVFAFADWVQLTGLGVAFVLVQAAAVAVLSELQLLGLRRRQMAMA